MTESDHSYFPGALVAMVLLLAGYPMTFPDAKAWALRNWPDMHIDDDDELPQIISEYHKEHKTYFRRMMCITLAVNGDLGVFFPWCGADDPCSTPSNYRQLIETSEARQFKDWLFKNEWDRELAAKTKWTTVGNPRFDRHFMEKGRAEYQRK